MNPVSALEATETLNFGMRKSPRSIRGSCSCFWRRTKATPMARPASPGPNDVHSWPSPANCLSPKITARTAASDITALVRSGRPADVSRNSGSSLGPSSNSTAITGTLIRKTEPHQKFSSSRPPVSSPIGPPAAKAAPQRLIAVVRWTGLWNMFRISESVEGAIVAPPMPSRARETMSISALVEKAASREATPNPVAPSMSTRRRPIRSPSVPMVIRNPATRNPYMSLIHRS